jgi:hypothetical protein
MSRQPFILLLAVTLALAATPVVAQDLGDDSSERHAPYQSESFGHAPYQSESFGYGRHQSESFGHGRHQSESFGHGRHQSESFGHGYDPYDDGREAWFAPEPYRGSWADHADAYYGYGECHFLRKPILGPWGEIVDYRRVRVCD